MEIKLDATRSAGIGGDSGSGSGSVDSSASSTARPFSQLSTGRPSVQFASPRTLAVNFPDSARYGSVDSSAAASPGSTSALSSSRVPLSSSSSVAAGSAHFEHELALQRREFEQRFADFQQRVSTDQTAADCAAYRRQIAAMSEQLTVQELFMACQRVELAHFHRQRQREVQQAEQQARTDIERREKQYDEQRSRVDSAATHSSVHALMSDAALSTANPSRPSRPATPTSALSSVSSVLEAAVSASSRSSAAQTVPASPYSIRPSSSSLPPSVSRPASAVLLSPRRPATAATAFQSALASPFHSLAARSASVLSTSSPPPYAHPSSAAAVGAYPFLSSAASATSLPSHSSPEPSLSDVLTLTESLLSQTDESLQAERRQCAMLQSGHSGHGAAGSSHQSPVRCGHGRSEGAVAHQSGGMQ